MESTELVARAYWQLATRLSSLSQMTSPFAGVQLATDAEPLSEHTLPAAQRQEPPVESQQHGAPALAAHDATSAMPTPVPAYVARAEAPHPQMPEAVWKQDVASAWQRQWPPTSIAVPLSARTSQQRTEPPSTLAGEHVPVGAPPSTGEQVQSTPGVTKHL